METDTEEGELQLEEGSEQESQTNDIQGTEVYNAEESWKVVGSHKAAKRKVEEGQQGRKENQDHTYNNKGKSRKTVRQDSRGEGECLPKRVRRVQDTAKKLWFFGDSQVKWITQDTGLVATAFENEWEVRMKRGVRFNEVWKMVEYNIRDMEEQDVVVILGGSNDLYQMDKMQNEEKRRFLKKEESYAEAVAKDLKGRRIKVIMVMTPPRRQGSERSLMDLQRMIRTIAKNTDADYLSVYKTEETRAQFQAEGLMEDGLHLTS